MLTAVSALWFSSSLPGASSRLDWPLTSMPYLEFFPACISWHWMPLSTAGDWCVCLFVRERESPSFAMIL